MARNILVVEDDNNISNLIKMYLDKEGFDVRIAADGGKAVEEFKEKEPDLVLLDVMLPRARRLGRMRPYPREGQDAHHYAHRQERRGRPHHRTGDGRGRLCRQAV